MAKDLAESFDRVDSALVMSGRSKLRMRIRPGLSATEVRCALGAGELSTLFAAFAECFDNCFFFVDADGHWGMDDAEFGDVAAE